MAYEGIHLNECRARPFRWSDTYIVIVSGARWNPCGHTVLNSGGRGGYYFQVGGDGAKAVYNKPLCMDESGFRRYLQENKKMELRRQRVVVPKPMAAQEKLDTLMSKPWLWTVLPHNCATFAEEILQAGGANIGITFNCPSRETWR